MNDRTPSAKAVSLKPCPFCGCADEMKVIDDSEMHEYCDYPADSDPTYAVVCDASRNGSQDVHHGCGAASGFKRTEAEAIEAWNTRSLPKLEHPETCPCTDCT